MPAEEFDEVDYVDPENQPKEDENSIFEDDNESCAATYKNFASLLRHLTKEKHVKVFQMYKVEDYALATYLNKLEEIDQNKTIQPIVDDLTLRV